MQDKFEAWLRLCARILFISITTYCALLWLFDLTVPIQGIIAGFTVIYLFLADVITLPRSVKVLLYVSEPKPQETEISNSRCCK